MARVLVVDDDLDLLEMMRVVLERGGEHVAILAANAEQGLARAKADTPDVAIVDLMMPRIDGYELIRRLRADPATAPLPIVVLTARGQSVDRQAALEAGANEFVAKPVGVQELLGAIGAAMAAPQKARAQQEASSVAVLSLRGGAGATTLATNLAVTLAGLLDRPVCLADLSPSSGHVALQLGLRPDPNWSGLAGMDDLDRDAVEALLIVHASGLKVLASPLVPVIGLGLPRKMVFALLDVLRLRHPVTVVDTPPVLNDMAVAILDAVTSILLVVTPEPPSVQTAVGTLRALSGWTEKIQIVLNHPTPDEPWPATAVERLLRRSPVGTVPFDPGQAQALRNRVPLALGNLDAPLAQGVRDIAAHVIRAGGDFRRI